MWQGTTQQFVFRSRFNGAYLHEIKWELRWTIKQIGEEWAQRFGRSPDYLYRIISDESRGNVTLETIDTLYSVLVARYQELGLAVPEDLWNKLLKQEWTPVE
jgi:hypothetical protein